MRAPHKLITTFITGIIATISLLAVASMAQAADPVLGKWLTKGGKSHVEITKCGAGLCGKIVWLKEPTYKDGKPKVDRKNKDTKLRSRPLMGLAIVQGFKKADDKGAYWTGGTIYNATDGKTYKCYIKLQSDGRLKVRGYVGIKLFGKTQYWTRVK
jgi:uncharacterized protein (DUF2147 family)